MRKSDNIIYKITNLINGKVYIGLTTQGLSRRKGEHVYRFNLGEREGGDKVSEETKQGYLRLGSSTTSPLGVGAK